MYMQSNEPYQRVDGNSEMNPYLKSALQSIGIAGAVELGTQVVYRGSKNAKSETGQKMNNFTKAALYHEDGLPPELLQKLSFGKLSYNKAEKYSKSHLSKVFGNGLSTMHGRINAYGVGTLAGLAITALTENSK